VGCRPARTVGAAMEMDTWYDLRIQQIFDLNDRVSELLDGVTDNGEGSAPAPVERVCDLTDRVSDFVKGVRSVK
jgi:hypothetical protein